jgi:hypothetical protein
VTVAAKTSTNAAWASATVNYSVAGPATLGAAQGTTDANGVATNTLTPTGTGNAVVTACVGGLLGTGAFAPCGNANAAVGAGQSPPPTPPASRATGPFVPEAVANGQWANLSTNPTTGAFQAVTVPSPSGHYSVALTPAGSGAANAQFTTSGGQSVGSPISFQTGLLQGQSGATEVGGATFCSVSAQNAKQEYAGAVASIPPQQGSGDSHMIFITFQNLATYTADIGAITRASGVPPQILFSPDCSLAFIFMWTFTPGSVNNTYNLAELVDIADQKVIAQVPLNPSTTGVNAPQVAIGPVMNSLQTVTVAIGGNVQTYTVAP